jgi:hypothetical protein
VEEREGAGGVTQSLYAHMNKRKKKNIKVDFLAITGLREI